MNPKGIAFTYLSFFSFYMYLHYKKNSELRLTCLNEYNQ